MFISLKLSENEGKQTAPKRIQLLKCGEFIQENGKKLAITPTLLSSFKKNFDDNARGYPDKQLPIDYFHENDKVAAAWIKTVEVEGDALFAEVEWTPRGEKIVSDRELRYVSVEFDFDYRHNEGGKRFGPTLFGAGLTNRPFVKGMNPVTLSEGDSSMTLEQALAKIAELEAKLKKYEGEAEQMSAVKTEMEGVKKELAETKKQLVDAVSKADADKKLAEKTNTFNKMLAEGKACEAQREHFISGDMVKFAETAKPLNSGSGHGGSGAGAGAGSGDENVTDQVVSLAEKMVKEKGMPFDKAVSAVLDSNAELSKKYHEQNTVK